MMEKPGFIGKVVDRVDREVDRGVEVELLRLPKFTRSNILEIEEMSLRRSKERLHALRQTSVVEAE